MRGGNNRGPRRAGNTTGKSRRTGQPRSHRRHRRPSSESLNTVAVQSPQQTLSADSEAHSLLSAPSLNTVADRLDSELQTQLQDLKLDLQHRPDQEAEA